MTNNTRLLRADDIKILRSMFDYNPYSNGIKLSEDDITQWCNNNIEGIKNGYKQVAINMDDNDDPIAMSSGTENPMINGWIQGISMVRYPLGHPLTIEKALPHASVILTPAMDLLVEYMESKKYYKFWDTTLHNKILNIGRRFVSKYTTRLNRYDHYDEMIIPAGKLSGVMLWDANRRINPTKDVTVRMYVLRQEYRLPLL